MKFCDRINQLLSDRDMLPTELARKSGIAESGIHYIRMGERYPNLHTALRIAKAFGMTLNELLEGVEC